MISVGLDVDRFNTIIMNSMPRNIAEYIQASSRVARNKLGLVVTLHNPFRARDLSHFERFREFHEKLYYYVEPISITPFSKKSVGKYMPLYNATIIRHYYEKLANAENAASLSVSMQQQIKQEMYVYFRHRLERTQVLSKELKELLTEELENYIELFIEEALAKWQESVNNQQRDEYTLRYSGSDYLNSNPRQKTKWKDLFLALDAYLDDESENMWAVPMSLRTVESEAVLNVKDN
jgi:superfamily II DNA/RNA helicase